MRRLKWLGVEFELVGEEVGNPVEGSGIKKLSGSGIIRDNSLVEFEAELDIHEAYSLSFSVSNVPLRQDGEGLLIPADGPVECMFFRLWRNPKPFSAIPFALSSGDALVIELGPLRLARNEMPTGAVNVDEGYVTVQVYHCRQVIPVMVGVPLVVEQPDDSRIRFNLADAGGKATVAARVGWLQTSCYTYVEFPDEDSGLEKAVAFNRTLSSEELRLDLDRDSSEADHLDLIMHPKDPERPLVLHAEYRDDGAVLGGLGVKQYQLKLRFSPADEERYAKLTRIWLEPTSAERAIGLICYGLADARNQAECWEFLEPIPLVIRLMNEGDGNQSVPRPGCFLVAAKDGMRRQAVRSQNAVWNMHGVAPKIEWVGVSSGYLICDPLYSDKDPQPNPKDFPTISPALFFNYTIPWLELNSPTLTHPKAGDSYRPDAEQGTSSIWDFSNDKVSAGTPILPNAILDKAGILADNFRYHILDRKVSELRHRLASARHASNMREMPISSAQQLQIQRLFQHPPSESFFLSLSGTENTIRLKTYEVIRIFGPIKVRIPVYPELPIDYVVIATADKFDTFNFPLDRAIESLTVSTKPTGINGVCGIVKLGSSVTLKQILQNLSWEPKVIEKLGIDPTVLDDAGWVGVVMFKVKLDFSDFAILEKLVKDDVLVLDYVAVSPAKTKDGEDFSVSGRVKWVNTNTSMDDSSREKEVQFQVKKVDIAWIDRGLRQFHVDSTLTFAGIFGLLTPKGEKRPEFQIIGSYSELNGKSVFRFLGQSSDPIPLLPQIDSDTWFGPFEQVFIERAEITESGGDVAIQLDGTVKLHSVPLPNLEKGIHAESGQSASFRGLGIRIPGPNNAGQWLSISYPSLKFDAKLPQFKFFGIDALDLKVRSIGLDWEGAFPWTSLVPIGRELEDRLGKAFLMDVRLSLMKLPELFARSLQGLSFDLSMGFGVGTDADPYFNDSRFNVGLTAVGFEKLHIDLMRFLEIKADELKLGVKDFGGADQVPTLELVNATVSILGHPVIQNLTAMFFATKSGKTGFLAYIVSKTEVSFIDVKWVLIGQNVALPTKLAKDILSIAPASNQDEISEGIRSAVDDKSLYLGTDGLQAEWLFAAGLSVASGVFDGKFLFHDGRHYGMSLQGTMLEEWFGYDLAISVLYEKGNRPSEDRLFLSFTVPKVAIGNFNFMGGVIDLGVVMNGGFLIDVGFPHLLTNNNGRAWDRALGAIVTPFQGSGGLYLRKEVAIVENGDVVSLMGGYALQAGLGASFGGGVFTAWVTAGLFVIAEGHFAFKKENFNELDGLRLVGAVGILVRGHAALDWWVISVNVDVRAEAEARLLLAWGTDPLDPRQELPPENPVTVNLEFVLTASASAEACIGSGPFKLCKGISVSVPMYFNQPLKLGRG